MYRKTSITLALAGGSLFWALPQGAMALSPEERLETMERRLLEIEGRLEKSEAENAELRRKLTGRSIPGSVASGTPAPTRNSEVKELNDKVATLEQKLEQDRKSAAAASKNLPKVEMGARGLTITSADGDHRLSLRGYAQGDGRFYMENSSGGTSPDHFLVRRARLTLDGTLFKWADFRFSPDFAQGNVRLYDAYLDLHYFTGASLMAGKFRSPINGLERQQSATNLMFVERALTADLTPVRDIGVMLHGEFPYPGYTVQYTMPPVFREFFTYQVGVFNGSRDSDNPDSEKDNNKEFAGRLFTHPFLHSGIDALRGVGVGIAGSWGQPRQNSLRNLASDGQLTFLTYHNGVTASGDAYRVTPQAYWYWGPFGMLTEYVLSSQRLRNQAGSHAVRQDNTAWQLALSYVLTGENNSFQGVKPAKPFNPAEGSWGAWQMSGRWSELDVDGDTFKFNGTFADPSKSASKATAWALGLNWWLNSNVTFMADYEQTYFQGGAAKGADRPMEKVFRTRFQYQF